VVQLYADGLEAYRKKSWDKAIEYFSKALSTIPDDGPSISMLQRCQAYRENPPDENWNGSFSMTTK
jgi:adenylate cyclase